MEMEREEVRKTVQVFFMDEKWVVGKAVGIEMIMRILIFLVLVLVIQYPSYPSIVNLAI